MEGSRFLFFEVNYLEFSSELSCFFGFLGYQMLGFPNLGIFECNLYDVLEKIFYFIFY